MKVWGDRMYRERSVDEVREEILKLLRHRSMVMLDIVNNLQRGGLVPVSQSTMESVMKSLEGFVYWTRTNRLAIVKG